jgi:RHS repeat-associated protein
LGRRVKKAVYAYGSGAWELQKEILFVYDGWNLIHEKEVSAAGDPLFDNFNVWGLDLSQTIQGAGGIGGLVCRVSGGEVRHYLYDANGNVGQLVNPADGAITARYEYDPFGNAVFVDGVDAVGNLFRFSTKCWAEETELYYFGHRHYLPKIGRWLNRDAIGEKGGNNLYEFALNNSIIYIDPYGMKTIKHVDPFGIVTYHFTNLNIWLFESKGCAVGPGLEVGGTPFATNAYSAGKGAQSFIIDKDGVYYFTIEDVAMLDKKLGLLNIVTLGRLGLSVASDLVFISTVYKGVESGAKAVEAVAGALTIKLTINAPNINLVVQNTASLAEEKHLKEHVKDIILNFLPFFGSVEIGEDLLDQLIEQQVAISGD